MMADLDNRNMLQCIIRDYKTIFTMDTGSFPGVKRPGRGADHPSPCAEVMKR